VDKTLCLYQTRKSDTFQIVHVSSSWEKRYFLYFRAAAKKAEEAHVLEKKIRHIDAEGPVETETVQLKPIDGLAFTKVLEDLKIGVRCLTI